MKALVQRVEKAAVAIAGGPRREIGRGFVVLLGVAEGDTEAAALWLAAKTAKLRVFSNTEGKFDLSLADVGGQALVVSQFTLLGDCAKGCRPDFAGAARPEEAKKLYQAYVDALAREGIPVQTGEFGAHMDVEIHNNGPVTIMLERI
ncbi:MAG: D-aminoacyl-tRNA deacylase [Elusimicrobiales bacterium]